MENKITEIRDIQEAGHFLLRAFERAAKEIIHPDELVWIIVGDKAKIEDGLKQLNYEIKFIDSEGNLIN